MPSVPVRVTEVVNETPTQITIRLDWGPKARPGQFIMVWIPGVDEVPMGFSHLSGYAGITVQRMGEATEALCDLQVDDVLGVRGPLGNGFGLEKGTRCLLVGGGNGTAPLVPLAEALMKMECAVYPVVGARTREELLFIDRLGEITGAPPSIATDDGSAGHHGFVPPLADRLMDELRPDIVYTCGPELMMRMVADSCWDRGIPFQASLERYMKCAIGMCDACAVGPFLVCKDGPVFDGNDLRGVEDFGNFKRGPSGLKEPMGKLPPKGQVKVLLRHEHQD
jgi:dihydroorotate dehydrogenase electron transfer subunit